MLQSLIYEHVPEPLTMAGLTLVLAAILGVASRDLCVGHRWILFICIRFKQVFWIFLFNNMTGRVMRKKKIRKRRIVAT